MIEDTIWNQYKDLEYYPDRVCVCGCEGLIKVKSYHKYYGIPKYIRGHDSKGKPSPRKIPVEVRTCAALGCTNNFECKITSKKKYCCRGHSRKGKNNSEEQNDKIRKNHKGGTTPKPREIRYCGCSCGGTFVCRKDSKQRFLPGHGTRGLPAWNKLPKEVRSCEYKECGKTFECLVNSEQKFCSPSCFHKSQKGKKLSKETIAKMKLKGNSPEYKERQKENSRQQWQDPEYREKMLKAILKGWKVKPNKPEKFLDNIFRGLFPNEYLLNVHGDIIIGCRCPDFVNVNGQKKIIEHFGDFHHGEGRTGVSIEQHERERIDHFAKYGYKTLIIWEHELEDVETLKKKILEFHNVL